MKVKIKSFDGELSNYLKMGKVYEFENTAYIGGFIKTVVGEVNIHLNNCDQLNGGSWEVVE